MTNFGEVTKLFKYLRSKKLLCHCTGIDQYKKIVADQYLSPNNGQYPSSFPQSNNSYARHKNYISLFDFVSPSIKECTEQSDNWLKFFYHFEPATIIFIFPQNALNNKIIENQEARQEVGYKKVWIPKVEVWYPEKITFEEIRSIIIISHKEPFNFKVFPAKDKEDIEKYIKQIEDNPAPSRSDKAMNNILDAISTLNIPE